MPVTTYPVSVVYLSAANILGLVTVTRLSSWDIGQPVQASMTQMAAVPWISSYPS